MKSTAKEPTASAKDFAATAKESAQPPTSVRTFY